LLGPAKLRNFENSHRWSLFPGYSDTVTSGVGIILSVYDLEQAGVVWRTADGDARPNDGRVCLCRSPAAEQGSIKELAIEYVQTLPGKAEYKPEQRKASI
jgi:hypothetical protein